MMGEKISDRVARGRAKFRTRVVAYAALGGYACVVLLGTVAGGNSGSVAVAVLLFGGVVFWLGRRSALESASAEAHAWAVATASAQATATALAGVQVNLNMDRGLVELSDATGLHRRELPVSPGRELPVGDNSARGRAVGAPLYERFAEQAREASQEDFLADRSSGEAAPQVWL